MELFEKPYQWGMFADINDRTLAVDAELPEQEVDMLAKRMEPIDGPRVLRARPIGMWHPTRHNQEFTGRDVKTVPVEFAPALAPNTILEDCLIYAVWAMHLMSPCIGEKPNMTR
jgi:hypothetical protein